MQPSRDTLPYSSFERGSLEVFDPDRARALGLAVSGDVRPAD